MLEFTSSQFLLFLAAALLLAISPGPGLAYVIARTASGGRQAGIASVLGTALGGMVHVLAAALGLSLLIAESAFWFNLFRYLGAAYLIYLGIRLWIASRVSEELISAKTAGGKRAFWEGVVIEALNVKTALFFLAFLPQFVDPAGNLLAQFVILGGICVMFNTGADLIAVFGSSILLRRAGASGFTQKLSGSLLIGLGALNLVVILAVVIV